LHRISCAHPRQINYYILDDFRKDYEKGFLLGQDPTQKRTDYIQDNAVLLNGFDNGRILYIKSNGSLEFGLPEKIVTKMLLEEYELLGSIGMPICVKGYTALQATLLRRSYFKGRNHHDPTGDIALCMLLQSTGIAISQKHTL
jgi:hypothetical protein